MFTNLIESSSHAREFKRRSSFFFATIAVYALLLSGATIVGILTYDARVEAQNRELGVEIWVPPVKTVTPEDPKPSKPVARHAEPTAQVDQHIKIPERMDRVPPVDDLRVSPESIGVKGSNTPPVEGDPNLTGRNADPPGSATSDKDGCPNCSGSTTTAVVKPQPTPEPTPVKPAGPQRLPSTMIMAKIINLPKPTYSTFAKQIRAQGPVNVQILIGEGGDVISAHAVGGHPALIQAAEDAAKRARFTPTILNGQPVKVQGVITYNFVLQ